MSKLGDLRRQRGDREALTVFDSFTGQTDQTFFLLFSNGGGIRAQTSQQGGNYWNPSD